MYRQIRGLGLACGAALAMTGSASAQVIPMSFAEIVTAADTIVVAEAIDARAQWVTTGASRAIITRITFRVTDTLKGLDRILLPLEFRGGTIGDVSYEVSGGTDVRTRRPSGAIRVGRPRGKPDRGAHARPLSDQHSAGRNRLRHAARPSRVLLRRSDRIAGSGEPHSDSDDDPYGLPGYG